MWRMGHGRVTFPASTLAWPAMTITVRIPLPVDPDLPAAFDETPHEDRSQAELEQWWDQPFLVTNGDGTFTARCLNGGAWDRSTFLGAGATIEEATAIGLAKQQEYLALRQRPVARWRPDGLFDVVVAPQRPDQQATVLKEALTDTEVKAILG